MSDIRFKVQCGFLKEDVITTMSIQNAYELLLTGERHKYVKLFNENGCAKLYKHILTCPHCGNKFGARSNYVTRDEFVNSHISNWLIGQLSLFEEQEDVILLAKENYISTCLNCGYKASVSDDFRTVSVSGDKSAIKVCCELKSINEAMLALDVGAMEAAYGFPVYETLEFNLKKGIVMLYLKDSAGILFACEDITNKYSKYSDGVLFDLVTKNEIVKRNIKQLFECGRNFAPPFHETELCMRKYVMMTTFVGYPRSFYDSIPYETDSDEISGSFEIDKKLKHSSEIATVYKNTSLPDVKSVRRIFFRNPGLFFYTKECEILWDIIADVNIFCQVLSGSGIFEILYKLHTYPGIAVFYSDYCNIKGTKKLCSLLSKNYKTLGIEEVRYYALNNWQKEKERQKWLESQNCFEKNVDVGTSDFSVLMNIGKIPVESTLVGGFRFTLLHTFKEYVEVGKMLNNCLTDWKPHENPVVAIYKNNYAIAAVELEGNKVIQVRYAGNKRIESNEHLKESFEKWCRGCGFVCGNYVLT